MKTINIIVEGPTEEEFVNNLIAPYLAGFGIVKAVPIPLETSPGYYRGDIRYSRYRDYADKLLVSAPNCIVTSLIDFYELRTDFPGYTAAFAMHSKNDQVYHIEQEISRDINNERLVPYIQLHEFEGLLFSDINGFQTYFSKIVSHAQYIINHYPNPEMINDNPETAPSVRLKDIFTKIPEKYIKPFHGPMIALENGIAPVISKCPRFRNWIDSLIAKATAP